MGGRACGGRELCRGERDTVRILRAAVGALAAASTRASTRRVIASASSCSPMNTVPSCRAGAGGFLVAVGAHDAVSIRGFSVRAVSTIFRT